jgi:hypothetical protein
VNKREFASLYKKYGAAAIASVFGVPTPSVRRWASQGPPAHLDSSLRMLEQARRHEGYEEKSLREMMKLAEDEGKLIKVKNYSRPRNGEKTTGYEVSRANHGFLNEATLLKLRAHLEKAKAAKGLPHWLASVTVSAFVEEAEKGLYMGKIIQVDHPDANQFVSEAILSSGLQGSRQEMIDALMNSLRSKMRESDTKFYLHGSYLSTYKYKTESETRELQTSRRKARRQRNAPKK